MERAATPQSPGRARATNRERGSSLLVALLIMAVLSLTSVMFLMLGDTEVKLSQSNLDEKQPLYVAEGVIQVVRDWFDDPDPASNPLVPDPRDTDRSRRRCDLDWDGALDDACDGSKGGLYEGGRGAWERLLFERPYRGRPEETFWGSRDAPDILITTTTPGGYLLRLNNLFRTSDSRTMRGLRVIEIRLFAPPLSPELKQRKGIATVEVTVEKKRRGRRVALRQVRAVLAEIPYPRPDGPIEAGGEVRLSGNAAAHWGGIVSETDIYLANAGAAAFPESALPRREFRAHQFEDFSPGALDRTADDGSLERQGTQNLLTELLGLSVEGLRPPAWRKPPGPAELEDPWLRLAALGDVFEGGTRLLEPHPWPWRWKPAEMPDLQRQEDQSHIFGRQAVARTPFAYSTWKAVAASGGRNVHHLVYAGLDDSGEPLFEQSGSSGARTAMDWTNTGESGRGTGIYFFDTMDGLDPARQGGRLTPPVQLGAAQPSDGPAYLARGLLLFNSVEIRSAGTGRAGRTIRANMPGEPFLDTGIDLDGSGFVGNTEEEIELTRNDRWDCDCDLDGDVDEDDYKVGFTAHDELLPGGYPDHYRDPRLGGSSRTEHQPHEPFLNLDYPEDGSRTHRVRTDYAAEGDAIVDYEGAGLLVGGGLTTTRGRDETGALVDLPVHLEGVLYNEGGWQGRGNFSAFGSVVLGGDFVATGAPDFWFDERIARGQWPPEELGLPRVLVTSLHEVRE